MKRWTVCVVALLLIPVLSLAQGAAQGTIQYKIPEGWTASAEQKPMRHATVITPEKIEVAVSVFPGDVGGMLSNLNRWRAQVGLDPIQQGDIEKNTTKTTVAAPDTTATLADFTGPKGRILVAVIPQGGRTWFVRAMGEPEPVGKAKTGFEAMVKSVTFGSK